MFVQVEQISPDMYCVARGAHDDMSDKLLLNQFLGINLELIISSMLKHNVNFLMMRFSRQVRIHATADALV